MEQYTPKNSSLNSVDSCDMKSCFNELKMLIMNHMDCLAEVDLLKETNQKVTKDINKIIKGKGLFLFFLFRNEN